MPEFLLFRIQRGEDFLRHHVFNANESSTRLRGIENTTLKNVFSDGGTVVVEFDLTLWVAIVKREPAKVRLEGLKRLKTLHRPRAQLRQNSLQNRTKKSMKGQTLKQQLFFAKIAAIPGTCTDLRRLGFAGCVRDTTSSR